MSQLDSGTLLHPDDDFNLLVGEMFDRPEEQDHDHTSSVLLLSSQRLDNNDPTSQLAKGAMFDPTRPRVNSNTTVFSHGKHQHPPDEVVVAPSSPRDAVPIELEIPAPPPPNRSCFPPRASSSRWEGASSSPGNATKAKPIPSYLRISMEAVSQQQQQQRGSRSREQQGLSGTLDSPSPRPPQQSSSSSRGGGGGAAGRARSDASSSSNTAKKSTLSKSAAAAAAVAVGSGDSPRLVTPRVATSMTPEEATAYLSHRLIQRSATAYDPHVPLQVALHRALITRVHSTVPHPADAAVSAKKQQEASSTTSAAQTTTRGDSEETKPLTLEPSLGAHSSDTSAGSSNNASPVSTGISTATAGAGSGSVSAAAAGAPFAGAELSSRRRDRSTSVVVLPKQQQQQQALSDTSSPKQSFDTMEEPHAGHHHHAAALLAASGGGVGSGSVSSRANSIVVVSNVRRASAVFRSTARRSSSTRRKTLVDLESELTASMDVLLQGDLQDAQHDGSGEDLDGSRRSDSQSGTHPFGSRNGDSGHGRRGRSRGGLTKQARSLYSIALPPSVTDPAAMAAADGDSTAAGNSQKNVLTTDHHTTDSPAQGISPNATMMGKPKKRTYPTLSLPSSELTVATLLPAMLALESDQIRTRVSTDIVLKFLESFAFQQLVAGVFWFSVVRQRRMKSESELLRAHTLFREAFLEFQPQHEGPITIELAEAVVRDSHHLFPRFSKSTNNPPGAMNGGGGGGGLPGDSPPPFLSPKSIGGDQPHSPSGGGGGISGTWNFTAMPPPVPSQLTPSPLHHHHHGGAAAASSMSASNQVVKLPDIASASNASGAHRKVSFAPPASSSISTTTASHFASATTASSSVLQEDRGPFPKTPTPPPPPVETIIIGDLSINPSPLQGGGPFQLPVPAAGAAVSCGPHPPPSLTSPPHLTGFQRVGMQMSDPALPSPGNELPSTTTLSTTTGGFYPPVLPLVLELRREALAAALDEYIISLAEVNDYVNMEMRLFDLMAVQFGRSFRDTKQDHDIFPYARKETIFSVLPTLLSHAAFYALVQLFPNDRDANLFNKKFRRELYRRVNFWCTGVSLQHAPTSHWPTPGAIEQEAALLAQVLTTDNQANGQYAVMKEFHRRAVHSTQKFSDWLRQQADDGSTNVPGGGGATAATATGKGGRDNNNKIAPTNLSFHALGGAHTDLHSPTASGTSPTSAVHHSNTAARRRLSREQHAKSQHHHQHHHHQHDHDAEGSGTGVQGTFIATRKATNYNMKKRASQQQVRRLSPASLTTSAHSPTVHLPPIVSTEAAGGGRSPNGKEKRVQQPTLQSSARPWFESGGVRGQLTAERAFEFGLHGVAAENSPEAAREAALRDAGAVLSEVPEPVPDSVGGLYHPNHGKEIHVPLTSPFMLSFAKLELSLPMRSTDAAGRELAPITFTALSHLDKYQGGISFAAYAARSAAHGDDAMQDMAKHDRQRALLERRLRLEAAHLQHVESLRVQYANKLIDYHLSARNPENQQNAIQAERLMRTALKCPVLSVAAFMTQSQQALKLYHEAVYHADHHTRVVLHDLSLKLACRVRSVQRLRGDVWGASNEQMQRRISGMATSTGGGQSLAAREATAKEPPPPAPSSSADPPPLAKPAAGVLEEYFRSFGSAARVPSSATADSTAVGSKSTAAVLLAKKQKKGGGSSTAAASGSGALTSKLLMDEDRMSHAAALILLDSHRGPQHQIMVDEEHAWRDLVRTAMTAFNESYQRNPACHFIPRYLRSSFHADGGKGGKGGGAAGGEAGEDPTMPDGVVTDEDRSAAFALFGPRAHQMSNATLEGLLPQIRAARIRTRQQQQQQLLIMQRLASSMNKSGKGLQNSVNGGPGKPDLAANAVAEHNARISDNAVIERMSKQLAAERQAEHDSLMRALEPIVNVSISAQPYALTSREHQQQQLLDGSTTMSQREVSDLLQASGGAAAASGYTPTPPPSRGTPLVPAELLRRLNSPPSALPQIATTASPHHQRQANSTTTASHFWMRGDSVVSTSFDPRASIALFGSATASPNAAHHTHPPPTNNNSRLQVPPTPAGGGGGGGRPPHSPRLSSFVTVNVLPSDETPNTNGGQRSSSFFLTAANVGGRNPLQQDEHHQDVNHNNGLLGFYGGLGNTAMMTSSVFEESQMGAGGGVKPPGEAKLRVQLKNQHVNVRKM